MKKVLLSVFLTAILGLTAAASEAGKPLIIQLIINQSTTQADLEKQIEFLQANGYDMLIEYVKFNQKGGVEAICGKVDFNKSSGTFETWNMGERSIVIKKGLLGQMCIEVGAKR